MIKFLETRSRIWMAPLLLGLGLTVFAVVLLRSSPATAVSVVASLTWAPSFVTQVVDAGETVTLPISFITSADLENLVVRVVPELVPFVEVDPTLLGNISAGEQVTFDLIISAPEDTPAQHVEGTVQLRSGRIPRKVFPPPLPVTVVVPITADQMLTELAGELIAGDVENVLTRFSPSQVNHDALAELDSEGRAKLAQVLTSGLVIEERDDYRVYETLWIEKDGTPFVEEFTVIRNELGEWIIISW